MAGKILLGVLCALLLLLMIALLIPVHVRFSYDRGELALRVRFGPLKLQIIPKKEAPQAKPRKKKPEKGEEKSPKKEKKPKAKINREQIFYALETLPPILGRALRRTGRRLRIQPLKVHLLIAGPDPAASAELYGRLEAALNAALPVLHRAIHIKEQDIRLFLDFQEERMDCIADAGCSLRPWDLVSVGVRAGGSLLKWFLGFRKLASPPPAEEGTDDDGERPEKAAEEKPEEAA